MADRTFTFNVPLLGVLSVIALIATVVFLVLGFYKHLGFLGLVLFCFGVVLGIVVGSVIFGVVWNDVLYHVISSVQKLQTLSDKIIVLTSLSVLPLVMLFRGGV